MADNYGRLAGPKVDGGERGRVVGAAVDARLGRFLGALNTASSQAEVGYVVAAHAASLWSARAAAVGVLDGAAVRLIGSVGYDCPTMETGARLPVTAGLPLTEAARSSQLTTQRGADGAGWVAAPVVGAGRAIGAVLLSLSAESESVDIALLSEVAQHTAGALRRVAPVGGALPVPQHTVQLAGLDIATHRAGAAGESSGDVVDVVSDGEAGCWIIVGDVCGSDVEAARIARDVLLLGGALAPVVGSPAALLERIDSVLRDGITDRFVTALAIRLQPTSSGGWNVTVASAGHPLPMLCRDGVATDLGQPGLPLNLETAVAHARLPESISTVRAGDVLVLATDGLTDRTRGTLTDLELAARAHACIGSSQTSEARLSTLLAAVEELHGPSRDDLAAVVVSVR